MLYAIQKTYMQLFHKNKFMSGERENDRMKIREVVILM